MAAYNATLRKLGQVDEVLAPAVPGHELLLLVAREGLEVGPRLVESLQLAPVAPR